MKKPNAVALGFLHEFSRIIQGIFKEFSRKNKSDLEIYFTKSRDTEGL